EKPAAANRLELAPLLVSATPLEPVLQFFTPCDVVALYAVFAEQPIDTQPGRTLRWPLEIVRPTAPAELAQPLVDAKQAGADGIEMNVIADRSQITVAAAINDQRLVTSAEDMAKEFVTPIKTFGVSAQEPLHAVDEIGIGRFEHEMKMIEHETK